MADEISTTVKTTSDGQVTISIERYQELLERAAAKPPVIRRVTKTPEVAAAENKAWGATFIVFGVASTIVGVLRFAAGVAQTKELKK